MLAFGRSSEPSPVFVAAAMLPPAAVGSLSLDDDGLGSPAIRGRSASALRGCPNSSAAIRDGTTTFFSHDT